MQKLRSSQHVPLLALHQVVGVVKHHTICVFFHSCFFLVPSFLFFNLKVMCACASDNLSAPFLNELICRKCLIAFQVN